MSELYSYNGIVLPALPTWDKDVYPYATIMYMPSQDNGYFAYFMYSDKPFEYNESTGYFVPSDAAITEHFTHTMTEGMITAWSENGNTGTGLYSQTDGSCFIWTSVDVYSTSGSLYLAATAPVPLSNVQDPGSYAHAGLHFIPPLPEWDKRVYPYGALTRDTCGEVEIYTLFYSDKPFYISIDDDILTADKYYSADDAKVICHMYLTTFGKAVWSAGFVTSKGFAFYDYKTDDQVELIWHNGIYNTDGSIKKQACLGPFLLGGNSGTKYLFSGKYVLPELPTWDKSVFPYAYISRAGNNDDGSYNYAYLVYFDKPAVIENNGAGTEDLPLYWLKSTDGTNLSYCIWVVALSEASAEEESSLYPGINTKTWLLSNADYALYTTASANQGPIWANPDVVDTEGVVFLEASEPVEYDEGNSGKKYYFNEYLLSELPNWDKEKFPYAVIFIDDFDENGDPQIAYLTVFDNIEGRVGTYDNGLTDAYAIKRGSIDFNVIQWYLALNETYAEEEADIFPGINTSTWASEDDTIAGASTNVFSIGEGIIWSNTQILNEDEAVVMEPSDPVADGESDGGDGGDDSGDSGTDTPAKPAPISLKQFSIGLLAGLNGQQIPMISYVPIIGYDYNGVILPKIRPIDIIAYHHAVIVGGTGGKYHLIVFNKKVNLSIDETTGSPSGFIAISGKTFYKIMANYSSADGSVQNQWIDFSTDELPGTGSVDNTEPLADNFISNGILWSSFNLYADNGDLLKSASRPKPVTGVSS